MKKFFPVIHVIHTTQAFNNVEIAIKSKADGIFLISHGYLNYLDLLELGREIRNKYPDLWIGYNFLDISINKFLIEFLSEMNSYCNAVWYDDSQMGVNQEQAKLISFLLRESKFKGESFGGVAFKYVKQPSSLSEAVRNAMGNMSAITTSGDGTGKAARPFKIKTMFEAITDGTPLAIASGIDSENLKDYIDYVDYFLVSTGISVDHSNLDKNKTIELSNLIHNYKEVQ